MTHSTAAGYASEVTALRRELETARGLLRRLALAHYHEAWRLTDAERFQLRDEISAALGEAGERGE